MSRTRGARAGGEGDLQSPVLVSDGDTATGQAKDAVGRQCASRPHSWGVRDWQGSARDRGQ